MQNTDTKPSIFSREFFLVSTIALLMAFNFFTLTATIPRYALEVFNMSETSAGVASGLFVGGMMASRMIAGRFVNQIGFRPMLLIGVSGMVIFSLGYFIASAPAALFVIRFFNGFSFGMASNTNITIISTIIPRERSGEGVGYYSLFPVVAWAMGPYFGVNFSETGNYTAIFLLVTIMPAISLALIPFLRVKGATVTTPAAIAVAEAAAKEAPVRLPQNQGKETLFDKYLERSALFIAISILIMPLFFTAVTSFAAVYAQVIKVENISYFFIFFPLALIVTRPFVSKLFDRYGAHKVVLPGAIIVSAGYLVFSQLTTLPMAIFAGILFGIGTGATQNSTLALAVKRSPRERLGITNATYFMFLDCGAALGPIIGGALIEIIGYRHTFLTGAFVTLLGMLFFFRFVPKD